MATTYYISAGIVPIDNSSGATAQTYYISAGLACNDSSASYTVTTLQGIHQHIAHRGIARLSYLYEKVKHGIHQAITPKTKIWEMFTSSVKHGIHQHITIKVSITILYLFTKAFQTIHQHIASRSFLTINYLWSAPRHGIHQHITVPAKLTLLYLWTRINHGISQHIAPKVNFALTYLILAIKQSIHLHITPVIKGSFLSFATASKHGIHQHIAVPTKLTLTYLWTKLKHGVSQHIAKKATVRYFYVDTAADAGGNGTTPETTGANCAWDTIADVNAASFLPGDVILFKRGCTWREQLTVPSSGAIGNPVTFGAYGTGNNPRILGSFQLSGFSDEGDNVWSISYATAITSLFFIDGDGTVHWGDNKAAVVNLVNLYDWTQVDNIVYVYATSDPDALWGSVEAPIRAYGIYATAKTYVVIDGFEIAYSNNSGHGIFLVAASNNCTIQNNTIHHIGDKGVDEPACGILIGRSSNCLITGNTVHNAARRGISLITVTAGWSASNHIIEHNTVYDCFHSGIDIANVLGTVSGNIVRYNYIYNTAAFEAATYTMQGIYQDGASGNVTNATQIYYNVIYNTSGKGIEIGAYSTDTLVYNNTIYQTHSSAAADQGVGLKFNSTGSSGHIAKNNIAWVRDVPFYVVDKTLVTANYNLWYNTVGTVYASIDGSAYHSDDQAAYKAATGFDANGKWEDPLFVDAAGADFRLQSGSPCINGGIDVGLTRDYSENPISGLPDIGAYEDVGVILVILDALHQHLVKKPALALSYLFSKIKHGISQQIAPKVALTITYLWSKPFQAIHQHLASKTAINLGYLWTKLFHGISQHIVPKVNVSLTYLFTKPFQAIHQHITVPAKLTLLYLWTKISHGISQHITPKVNISLTYLFTKPFQTIHQHIAQIVSVNVGAAVAIILAIKQSIHQHITPPILSIWKAVSVPINYGIHQHIASKSALVLTYLWSKPFHAIHQHLASKSGITLAYLWTALFHGISQHIAPTVNISLTYLFIKPFQAIHQHITYPVFLKLTYLWTAVVGGIHQHIGSKPLMWLNYLWLAMKHAVHQSIATIATLEVTFVILVKQAIHQIISIKTYLSVNLVWLGVKKFITKALNYFTKSGAATGTFTTATDEYYFILDSMAGRFDGTKSDHYFTTRRD